MEACGGFNSICQKRLWLPLENRVLNKINPTFFLYKQRFPEKQACEHVGIIPSGNFSSILRTKEMIRKGKESVASLMNVGVRPGGLNPICGAEV